MFDVGTRRVDNQSVRVLPAGSDPNSGHTGIIPHRCPLLRHTQRETMPIVRYCTGLHKRIQHGLRQVVAIPRRGTSPPTGSRQTPLTPMRFRTRHNHPNLHDPLPLNPGTTGLKPCRMNTGLRLPVTLARECADTIPDPGEPRPGRRMRFPRNLQAKLT